MSTRTQRIDAFVKIKLDEGVEPPVLATGGSAGLDLRSSEEVTIEPHSTVAVNTGIKLEIQMYFEGQVRGRSGLAKNGITVPNSPGTIDSDYRGYVKVLLHNSTETAFKIESGDRIAQLVIAEIPKVIFQIVDDLSETDRGEAGFGSTGIK